MNIRLVCWLLLGTSMTACATQRLRLPSDIGAQYTVLEVRDRSRWGSFSSETFKLGDYAVQGVDREGDESSSVKAGDISHGARSSGGGYALRDGETKLDGKCGTVTSEDKVALGKILKLKSEAASITCSCQRGEQTARVFLAGDSYEFEGTLQTSNATYSIKSLHEVDVGAVPAEPVGYRVDGERPAGAVDVLFPGGAWLDPELSSDERRELACLFAGLMLYKARLPEE